MFFFKESFFAPTFRARLIFGVNLDVKQIIEVLRLSLVQVNLGRFVVGKDITISGKEWFVGGVRAFAKRS